MADSTVEIEGRDEESPFLFKDDMTASSSLIKRSWLIEGGLSITLPSQSKNELSFCEKWVEFGFQCEASGVRNKTSNLSISGRLGFL